MGSEKTTKFKVGKAYQHKSGRQMFVLAAAKTMFYGQTLIAETGWCPVALQSQIKRLSKEGKSRSINFLFIHQLTYVSEYPLNEADWKPIPKAKFEKDNLGINDD